MDGHGAVGDMNFDLALWNLVIRPTRSVYDASQLGLPEFKVGDVAVVREDVELRTDRGGLLYCSHFFPKSARRRSEGAEVARLPVVVYLHGNSSNRLEAGGVVGTLLTFGISLFCFDAAGCGLSEGEYISLGWHEKEDLALVLAHLRSRPDTGPIGLWGRSMGAVTALLHADRDPALSAICLDSPFASLRRVAEDLAQSRYVLFKPPAWLVEAALAVVRMRVKALADFDIEDVVPLEHARRSSVPAIFMHARQDTFISTSHSKQLYNAYLGPKQMVTIEGDHNSERSQQAVNQAVGFFRRYFAATCARASGDAGGAGTSSLSLALLHPATLQAPPAPPVAPLPPPPPPPPGPAGSQLHQRSMSWTPPPTQALQPPRLPQQPQPFAPTVQAMPALPPGATPLVTLEYSPAWQAALEAKLHQLGLATPEARRRLLAVDRMGAPVGSLQGPWAVPAARFPITLLLDGSPAAPRGWKPQPTAAVPMQRARAAAGGA